MKCAPARGCVDLNVGRQDCPEDAEHYLQVACPLVICFGVLSSHTGFHLTSFYFSLFFLEPQGGGAVKAHIADYLINALVTPASHPHSRVERKQTQSTTSPLSLTSTLSSSNVNVVVTRTYHPLPCRCWAPTRQRSVQRCPHTPAAAHAMLNRPASSALVHRAQDREMPASTHRVRSMKELGSWEGTSWRLRREVACQRHQRLRDSVVRLRMRGREPTFFASPLFPRWRCARARPPPPSGLWWSGWSQGCSAQRSLGGWDLCP